MALTNYRFFPWVRSGLAAVLPDEAPTGARAIARLTVTITPEVARSRDVELLGPGDAAGIDTRFIVRTDPRPNARSVEPNYLASIEFDRPDFPWLLTPRGVPANNRLQPWLVLVVLDRDRVGDPQIGPGRPLPTLTLDNSAIKDELPKLPDSWAWAHAQRLALEEADDAAELERNPDSNVSRLLCPRRLLPNRRWLACLVPAFDSGVAAALGQPPSGGAPKDAWADDTQTITLPLFFHWTFETGEDGDFEKLASRLTPHKAAGANLPPEVARRARVYLGAADASAELKSALPPDETASSIRIDAVLETLDRAVGKPAEVPAVISKMLAAVTAPVDPDDGSVLGPPLSGARIVGRDQARHGDRDEHWFDELNLDPRMRIAARTGADGIRGYQEELMQAAWEQVGNVIEANAQLDRSRFAAAIAERAFERHVGRLPAERQLALLAPAFARTRVGEANARALVQRTSLPDRTFESSLRRLTGANSRLARTVTRPSAVPAIPFAGVAEVLQREESKADPGIVERDGIGGSRFARKLIEARGGDVEVALPNGNTFAARSLAEAPRSPAVRLTPRTDLAEGVLSDRNRREILELAAAERVEPQILEKAVWEAAGRAEENAILVLRREGRRLKVDPIVRAANGEVSLLAADGRKTLFTLEVQSEDEPDPLTLARLAFKIPASVEPGRNLTVLLDGQRGSHTASFAKAQLRGLGGRNSAERARRRLEAIREAHRDAGVEPEAVEVDNPVIGTMTAPLRGAAAADAIRKAFDQVFGTLVEPADPALVPFDLADGPGSPLTVITAAVQPAQSFRARLQAMVTIPDWLPDRLDVFQPVQAAPEFQAALATFLSTSNPEAFVPRDIVLPAESVCALQTNPRWEAAALVGANHEINRELIWRTYPTDGRGTSLRRFWPWLDPEQDDISPIVGWPAGGPLAARFGTGKGTLVIAVRGALLQRYPNTAIYAWKAEGPELLAAIPNDPAARRTVIRDAQFRQFVGPDLSLAGLDLTPEEFLEGWFLILQEPISESRFGLDEEGTPSGGGRNANDRNWAESQVPGGGHLGADFFGASATSATAASILLQRPVRVAIHSDQLAPALRED